MDEANEFIKVMGLSAKLSTMIDKFSSIMESFAKLTEENRGFSKTITEASYNLLEIQKLRVRELELLIERARESNGMSGMSYQPQNILERSNNLENVDMNTKSIHARGNETPMNMDEQLHSDEDLGNSRNFIPTEYKLTQKISWYLWIDKLRGELLLKDLLDVIDDEHPNPSNLSEPQLKRRKSLVISIIMSRIDEKYYERIYNESEPKIIIAKLKETKRNEKNIPPSALKTQLYQIKIRNNETIMDFCERFDTLVRDYESFNDVTPLAEQEKRSLFYQAVLPVIPELRSVDMIRKQMALSELTYDEMKNFIFQLEGEKRLSDKSRENLENSQIGILDRKKPKPATALSGRCHRCNGLDHWVTDCPLNSGNKWYCYCCKSIQTHKGDTCLKNTRLPLKRLDKYKKINTPKYPKPSSSPLKPVFIKSKAKMYKLDSSKYTKIRRGSDDDHRGRSSDDSLDRDYQR